MKIHLKAVDMSKFLIFILILSPGLSMARDTGSCPCCSGPYRAFDFWLGDWTVYNTGGEVVGTNTIIEMQDGCLIQENWEAADGSNTGTSYNYYDRKDSTWNQVWISDSGFILELKGNPDSTGTMVLKSELLNNQDGVYYHQIAWTRNEDGSVRQQWDMYREDGSLIRELFAGIYRKE